MSRIKQQDIFAFVQVRLGSKRLPGKVLKKFSNGRTLFDLVIESLQHSQFLTPDQIVILTSDNTIDDPLADYAESNGHTVFRGHESNVLKRFYDAARIFRSDYYIRICGDNPFIQPQLMDDLIKVIMKGTNADYIAHQTLNKVPSILTHYGFFTEIISDSALNKAFRIAKNDPDKEHVTSIFYKHPELFDLHYEFIPEELEGRSVRLTIDTENDFNVVDGLLSDFDAESETSYKHILAYLDQHPILLKQMASTIEKNIK